MKTVKGLSFSLNKNLMALTIDFCKFKLPFDMYKSASLKSRTRQHRQMVEAQVHYQARDETIIRQLLSHAQINGRFDEVSRKKVLELNKIVKTVHYLSSRQNPKHQRCRSAS